MTKIKANMYPNPPRKHTKNHENAESSKALWFLPFHKNHTKYNDVTFQAFFLFFPTKGVIMYLP